MLPPGRETRRLSCPHAGLLYVDRVLYSSVVYPHNYGAGLVILCFLPSNWIAWICRCPASCHPCRHLWRRPGARNPPNPFAFSLGRLHPTHVLPRPRPAGCAGADAGELWTPPASTAAAPCVARERAGGRQPARGGWHCPPARWAFSRGPSPAPPAIERELVPPAAFAPPCLRQEPVAPFSFLRCKPIGVMQVGAGRGLQGG